MGSLLPEPVTQKSIKEGKGNGLTYCMGEMQGWRQKMEDASLYVVDLEGGNSLFAIFDGHGGYEVSKFVQAKFIDMLVHLPAYQQKKYSLALYQTFRLMDELIKSQNATKFLNGQRNMPESEPISLQTGSTANVVLITSDQYIVANIGDSRSVLCRGGKAIELSFDHKPDNQIEEKRITNAGGVIQMGRVNGGLNLSRSFGDFDYKKNQKLGWQEQMITCEPDIKQITRSAEDEFIIVGCDGIWQKYADNNQGLIDLMIDKIAKKRQNRLVIEELLDELVGKDTASGLGLDNMTCILIKFK